MKVTEKEYTIDGVNFVQRPLSPFQLIRLIGTLSEIQDSIKEKFTSVVNDTGIEIDLTQIMQFLEADDGVVLQKLMCVVLIDAESNKPVYLLDAKTQAHLKQTNAETLVEVVADFFTLNNVSKMASNFSKIGAQSRTLFPPSVNK